MGKQKANIYKTFSIRNCESIAMTQKDYEVLQNFVLDFSVPTEFVQLARIDGMKFIIRSNEQSGHHIPHIHLETSSASLSIEIETQKVLAAKGKINPSQLKKATKWIQDNQELIKRNWNEFSNGIEIAI